MRVALDLRWLQQAYVNSPAGGLGGIATFSRNLWLGLAELSHEIELVAILRRSPIAPALEALLARAPQAEVIQLGARQLVFAEARASRRLIGRFLEAMVTGLPCLARHRVDVFHSLDHSPPPRGVACATVITVYDLIGLADPPAGADLKSRLVARYQQLSATRWGRATALAPISTATAGQLRARFPDWSLPVEVIQPGIDTGTDADDAGAAASPPRPSGLPAFYFLHVGLLTSRKNPQGVIAGFRKWTSAHGRNAMLVCVGPYECNPLLRTQIAETARSEGIADLVIVRDAVNVSELAGLYRHAAALVFPSFDEGFGMPLLESLAQGTACVASEQPAVREAAGALGIYVDPYSSTSIAFGIERACEKEHRSLVRQQGPAWSQQFSVQAMAGRYLDLYRRCLVEHAR